MAPSTKYIDPVVILKLHSVDCIPFGRAAFVLIKLQKNTLPHSTAAYEVKYGRIIIGYH